MMGRERAIIRWEVQRQMLVDELHRLEQSLAATAPGEQDVVEGLRTRKAELEARLRAMGPDPRAKMG
jgi:hypothetical protein